LPVAWSFLLPPARHDAPSAPPLHVAARPAPARCHGPRRQPQLLGRGPDDALLGLLQALVCLDQQGLVFPARQVVLGRRQAHRLQRRHRLQWRLCLPLLRPAALGNQRHPLLRLRRRLHHPGPDGRRHRGCLVLCLLPARLYQRPAARQEHDCPGLQHGLRPTDAEPFHARSTFFFFFSFFSSVVDDSAKQAARFPVETRRRTMGVRASSMSTRVSLDRTRRVSAAETTVPVYQSSSVRAASGALIG
jgi:hypothetical protein